MQSKAHLRVAPPTVPLLAASSATKSRPTEPNAATMGESTKASDAAPQALGFLTVVEHDQFGLVGGYLILNSSGRPLEFHCTAPVKPSRAQQILYGPTLTPYLYGEQ